jgi:hypothetical protein
MDPLDPYSTVVPPLSLYATRAPDEPPERQAVTGRTVGNYTIERELGRGGMGVVYAATHRQFSDRRYALKLISAAAASPLACARFQREVDAIGKSRHPHLLYAVDAGVHEGDPYLVTELVNGYDLGRLLRHHGSLPASVACEIGRQMALGLEFVHATGMVHRDIKPHNVMLQPNGQIKILDLGLATLLKKDGETLRADGGVVGTPAYMPPEQWRGEEPSPASDVYAFGCTLLEMLTGQSPFPASQYRDIAAQRSAHLEAAAPTIAEMVPHMPPDVARLIDQCLQKSPDQRPQHCGEIAAVLEEHAAPIDTSKVFAKIVGHGGDTGANEIHYDQFVEEIRFPKGTPRERTTYIAVFLVTLLTSLASLAAAYFGPSTTAAWELRFDRLAGQTVPRGTGFVIEAIRSTLFLSCTFFVGYSRFRLPLARLFSIHLHTWRVWFARLLLAVVVGGFLGLECCRLWYPENAASNMVAWATGKGINTTPDMEVVPYRWYLGYSLIQYTFNLGGLLMLPVLQFVLSDFPYVQRSLRLFSAAQRSEPNAMQAVDRLYNLARHFRRLATRYVDTAGMLAMFIQYEYWIGRRTLSENGYLVEVVGMLVTAGIMLAIITVIAMRYGEAVEVTSYSRGDRPDHRVERQMEEFNVFWLIKSAVFSRPSGFAIVSLLLLLFESARKSGL